MTESPGGFFCPLSRVNRPEVSLRDERPTDADGVGFGFGTEWTCERSGARTNEPRSGDLCRGDTEEGLAGQATNATIRGTTNNAAFSFG